MKRKKIEKIVDYAVTFDEEELSQLGWKVGDKLFVEDNKDGSILISKGEEIEIDLSEFSNDSLINIIKYMNEKDITFGEFVCNSLREMIDGYGDDLDSIC